MLSRLIALLTFAVALAMGGPAYAAPSHPVLDLEGTTVEGHLHFYYPQRFTPEAELLTERVPTLRDELLVDFPPEALPETHIYLLPDIADYFTAQGLPPRSPHWASGLALSHENVILIRLQPTPGGRVELTRTLKHELSHIALRHYTQHRPLPKWFVEGVALVQSEPWTLERAQSMIDAGMADSLIPLSQLQRQFPAGRVSLAYAESAHFMRWLFREHGREHLRPLIERLRTGVPFDEAFAATYGEPLAEAESRWESELEEAGGGWWTLLLGSAFLFFVTSVFAGFMFWRVKRRRDRDLARLKPRRAPTDPPIPEHLENFGPFTG